MIEASLLHQEVSTSAVSMSRRRLTGRRFRNPELPEPVREFLQLKYLYSDAATAHTVASPASASQPQRGQQLRRNLAVVSKIGVLAATLAVFAAIAWVGQEQQTAVSGRAYDTVDAGSTAMDRTLTAAQ